MLEEGEHGWEAIVAAQSTSGRFHQASPKTEFAVCDLSDEGHLVLCDLDPGLPPFRRHGASRGWLFNGRVKRRSDLAADAAWNTYRKLAYAQVTTGYAGVLP